MISPKLQHNLDIRAYNTSVMQQMLKDSIARITIQGKPCKIPYNDYASAAYTNPAEKTRDSVAIITNIPDKFLKKYFGGVEEDSCKPIVKNISHLYKFNRERDCEVARLTRFLLSLQNAHDLAADSGDDFVADFTSMCNKITFTL